MARSLIRPYVGIDPDTKGIAWFMMDSDNYTYLGHGYLSRKDKKGKILTTFPQDLTKLLTKLNDASASILLEEIFCRSRKGFQSLAQVQGAFLHEAIRIGYLQEIPTVYASQWQSVVFSWYSGTLEGDTKAKALIVAREIAKGVVFKNEHEVDACCIAAYGIWKYVHASDKKKTPLG